MFKLFLSLAAIAVVSGFQMSAQATSCGRPPSWFEMFEETKGDDFLALVVEFDGMVSKKNDGRTDVSYQRLAVKRSLHGDIKARGVLIRRPFMCGEYVHFSKSKQALIIVRPIDLESNGDLQVQLIGNSNESNLGGSQVPLFQMSGVDVVKVPKARPEHLKGVKVYVSDQDSVTISAEDYVLGVSKKSKTVFDEFGCDATLTRFTRNPDPNAQKKTLMDSVEVGQSKAFDKDLRSEIALQLKPKADWTDLPVGEIRVAVGYSIKANHGDRLQIQLQPGNTFAFERWKRSFENAAKENPELLNNVIYKDDTNVYVRPPEVVKTELYGGLPFVFRRLSQTHSLAEGAPTYAVHLFCGFSQHLEFEK